ncbi:YihY/virulence factor BrkB family protein [Sphingomonas sp.]|jgi:membrane protein|uniref:YihY/virulence factor BrkB family protein n=1 Tax=Sphingomonas sp. TaxID=28214 RepID=UPI002EDA1568
MTKAAAPSPWSMPAARWKTVLLRTWAEISDDDIGLIAAGAAFYGFLAIVPALGAIVLLYGLLAEPETVSRHIGELFQNLPRPAAEAIAVQLATVVETSGAKKGFGLLIALALAIYGASKGAAAMRTALNIAYGLKEHRSFLRLQLLALGMVVGGIALIVLALAANAAIAWVEAFVPSPVMELLLKALSYLVLGALAVTGAACLYRYGPNHHKPHWAWLSPGALAAALLWLAGTGGFGLYASRFGSYGATYGSLSAVVVLLTWLWLSAYVFLLGGELNSEIACEMAESPESPITPAEAPGSGVGLGDQQGATVPPASPPERSPGPLASSFETKLGGRLAGAKVGLPTALLAGVGLARLRRGSANGFALVAGSAALAWITRRR